MKNLIVLIIVFILASLQLEAEIKGTNTTPSRLEPWETIVNNYETHSCLLCGRNDIGDWAAKHDKYCKALKLMKDGKTEKAVNLMEQVALNPKSYYINTSSAIYQLLYFKQFGSFDFVFDWDYVIDYEHHFYTDALAISKEVQTIDSFPVEYSPSEKNLKKYKKKNQKHNSVLSIDEISKSSALYVGLLPIHGDVVNVIKQHTSMRPDDPYSRGKSCLSLDSLIMSSLEEYKRRVENGYTYSDKFKADDEKILAFITSSWYSNREPSLESIAKKNFAINKFLPFITCDGSSKLFRHSSSSDTLYQVSKFRKGVISKTLLLRASSMGNKAAFADLLSLILGIPHEENQNWKLSDYKKARTDIKALLEYQQFNIFAPILKQSINSLDDIIDELQAIKDAEDAERRKWLAEYEREKQQKKAEKRQRILSAIGGVLSVAAQTYAAVQSNNTSSVSSYNLSGNNSSAASGIAQKIENPQYFQDTFNQIMQASINQVRQEEYNEYNLARQGYQQMGKDITLDEWRSLQGQAILDLKEQGVDIIADQKQELNRMNQEFKDGIDKDRNDRLNQIRQANSMKYGSSSISSLAQNTTTSSNFSDISNEISANATSSESSQTTNTRNNGNSGKIQNSNDSHEQYKSGNLNTKSSDYTHKRDVTLYRKINGKWTKSNLGSRELCDKDGILYVNVGNTYYKVQSATGTTDYRNMVVVGSVAHYFN